MKHINLRAATCLVLSSAIPAQLAISEALVDPVGQNSGNQIIEIVNTTKTAFTPNGWQICSPFPFTYAAFPSIAIPAGGVVQLHIRASGIDSTTDFFFPFNRDLGFSDTFLIFRSANFNNANDIVDFVSWGGGTGRIGQAVSVKQWDATNATVALPMGEGKTISWDGAGHAAADWLAANPSLGKPNRIAAFKRFGAGCGANPIGAPVLSASPRPRIGGTFDVTGSNLPQGASLPTFLVIGISNSSWNGTPLPLDLTIIGAPGCNLLASFDVVVPAGNGSLAVKVPMPTDPKLIGVKFYMQGYAIFPSANAANLILTNGIEGMAGN